MLNLRKEKRIKAEFQVTVIPSENAYIRLSAVCLDISEGGIRVALPSSLIVGSTVSVYFSFPEIDDELSLVGDVIWVHASAKANGRMDTGIKFSFMSDEKAEKLRSFVLSKVGMKTGDNSYMEAYRSINTSAELDAANYDSKKRTLIFSAMIAFYITTVIVLFLLLAKYLDKTGLWGYHF